MRIATWNLESAEALTRKREEAFFQAMTQVNADVWVLTETWRDLSPLPGFRSLAQSSEARDLEDCRHRCSVSIWIKSELHAEPLRVNCQSDRVACGRIQTDLHQHITVVGNVLPWGNDSLWPGAEGFCAALAQQAEEWGRLRSAAEPCAFLIAGDFNLAISYQRYYGSRQGVRAMEDVLARHELICLTPGNEPIKGLPRIDHICIGRDGIKPPSVPLVGAWSIPTVNEQPITDHVGVFVDLDPSAA